MLRSFAAGLAIMSAVVLAGTAPAAADPEQAFLQSVSGQWTGPGEIVAGKYKGTRFTCSLAGDATSGSELSIALDGSCRVGLFAQPMSARVARRDGRFSGSFLDGSAGAGLDITSGVLQGDRMVFALGRKQLNGAMVARLSGSDQLAVTVSVRVGTELVPVIGMNLQRTGAPVRRSALAN